MSPLMVNNVMLSEVEAQIPNSHRMSLRAKMLLSIGFIIFVVLGTSTLIHIHNVRQIYLKEIELRSEALAQSIIGYILEHEFMMSIGGTQLDSQLIHTTLQISAEAVSKIYELNKKKDLLFIAVIDPDGIIAAHNDIEKWDTSVEAQLLKAQLQNQKQTIIFDETAYHTLIPIMSERNGYLGAIDIGMSPQGIQGKIRQALIQTGSLFLLFLVVAFIAVSLLVHVFVTKPLKILTNLGKKIARGELYTIAEFGVRKEKTGALLEKISRDELGELTHAFHEMIAYFQQIVDIASHIADGDLVHTITPRSKHDVLGIAFQDMISYLGDMVESAAIISHGVLDQPIQPKNERDVLGTAFSQMIIYIQDIADITEKISEGDLHVEVNPRSDQDVLNQSLQKMIRYIQNVEAIVEQIARNNLDIEVIPQSKQDLLNISLQRMVNNLRVTHTKIEHSMTEVERQNWVKTGQAELSDVIRADQEPVVLAKHIITYLTRYLQAQVGAIYLVHKDNGGIPYLKLTASYAYTRRDANRDTFRFGEGLVGQAALEQECQMYFNLSEDTILISTDAGEIIPGTVLIAPFLYEQAVKGVIELGTTGEFAEIHLEFLQEIMENIATAFD